MRIALACEGGRISPRFCCASEFAIFELEFGKIGSSSVETPDCGDFVRFLRDRGIDLVICGRIGSASQRALLEEGIKLFGGVSGRADQVMASYLNGALDPVADFKDDGEP